MALARVIKLLDTVKVKYGIITHKTVYTASDRAATLHVPEKQVAKTLVMKVNGDFVVAVLPACCRLEKVALKKAVNSWRKKKGLKAVKKIDFAKEAWMKKNLKGVKVGAVPPFGSLWKMPTFVDRTLLNNKEIIVSAGNYERSLRITSAAYKKTLQDFIIGRFGKKR